MIESLLVLLAMVALLATVAAAWLYGTEQGWRRRHEAHGEPTLERAPDAYDLVAPYHRRLRSRTWTCPCGSTLTIERETKRRARRWTW